MTAEQRPDLMEIVDDRHDRASTIVTSQVPVELWHEHICNPTMADAALDRLVRVLATQPGRAPLNFERPLVGCSVSQVNDRKWRVAALTPVERSPHVP